MSHFSSPISSLLKRSSNLTELGRPSISREGPGRMCDEGSCDLRYLVTEELLVDVCLHDIMVEYRIYLENMSFCFFSKLMEVARCTNESVK